MEIQPYSFKNLRKEVRAIVNAEEVSDYNKVAALLNKRGFRTRFGTEFTYSAVGNLVRKHGKSNLKRTHSKSEIVTARSTDNGAIASLILESNLTKGQKLKALEAIL